jgi:arylsulfatase A-like enzyme
VVARNAIIIVIDTLRADRVGHLGAKRPTTPRVDQLARDGTTFADAHANSPWTVPSTATILTSLYPTEHGAQVEGPVRNLGETPPRQIRDGVPTLATILAGVGFRTGLFSANPYLYGRFKDGFQMSVVDRVAADRITDNALEFIEAAGPNRFFVHIQYMDLHQPLEPPEPFFDMFTTPEAGPRDSRHKEWAFSDGTNLETKQFSDFRANRLALYDGALRFVDTEIGRLLDALSRAGVLDETLVMVTSDHGEEFWDHAALEASLGGDPRGIYGIGHGHSMFEELLRIPLVFAGPGVHGGLVVNEPISLLDVAPTILGFLKVDPPAGMRGTNLRQMLGGDTESRPPSYMIYAESPAYGPDSWTLIEGGWKLIERDDGVILLFDLDHDPGETTNKTTNFQDKVIMMNDKVARLQASFEFAEPAESLPIDEATEEQLRVLGYVN